jgi:glutamate/tyrosine decarboxylase-like PLP-dependent enzyme
MDYGPQLWRAFKAFKIWCALRALGTAALRAAIDRALDLADQLGDRIDADPALELLTPVTTTAVCLRIPGVDHPSGASDVGRRRDRAAGPGRGRHRAQRSTRRRLGLVPVVVTDVCGAGNRSAAERSLDALRFAGDAILTDTATFTGLLARPTSGGSGPSGPQPR